MLQRIAFYAPLKSPNHSAPSGDRTMARGILAALHDLPDAPTVELVSELRSRDGDGSHQAEIRAAADRETARLLSGNPDWQIWVTYHNYYKAPDLLGPTIARRLNIPYVLIEASRSPKRLQGPWADFAARSEAACDAANTIFYMTERDRPALAAAKPPTQRLVHLPPFLNRSTLPPLANGTDLLAVGMLRSGDKLASYRVLAEALPHCRQPWRLRIVGDGPARNEIKALFAGFGDRVTFSGQLAADRVSAEMAQAGLFVWPGVNEAFGMVYLEAQAHGLRAIAQNRPGVRDVIAPTGSLTDPEDPRDFARAIDAALRNSNPLASTTTQHYISENHLRPAAAALFTQELTDLLEPFG